MTRERETTEACEEEDAMNVSDERKMGVSVGAECPVNGVSELIHFISMDVRIADEQTLRYSCVAQGLMYSIFVRPMT